MSTRWIVAGAALFGVLMLPLPVHSQETGLASIHAWVPVGRKTCMETHFHDGSGTGKTKREAERDAIRSWEVFTIWEYGRPWGRYAHSESKRMTCSKKAPNEFSCDVTSRPCAMRAARVAKARKRR
jgi:hypothetical protein